jgi:hypothetical protein
MKTNLTLLAGFFSLLLSLAPSAGANTIQSYDPKVRIGKVDIQLVFQDGNRYDRFHYYPRYEVYYSYHQDLYFWFDRGRWQHGYHLPYSLRNVYRDRYIIVHGRYDRPWQYDGKRRYEDPRDYDRYYRDRNNQRDGRYRDRDYGWDKDRDRDRDRNRDWDQDRDRNQNRDRDQDRNRNDDRRNKNNPDKSQGRNY